MLVAREKEIGLPHGRPFVETGVPSRRQIRGPAGKIEILEPSRLPMASIYFYSPHSQLFNGVLIIKKYYRGAELGIALIWDLMTQSRSQVGQEMCVTDVLKVKTCSLFTSPLSEFVDVTFILWFLP